ncbi:GerMN domain-containing protein [Symbiobacterium thermophilum]|uniref:GerMN domain-containing protein n=1 Tax=Symbiobacterium thermophilum TaxID=2734 RepID=A0A953IBR3_SYMTR|nr:GerMN domain-containing protein [Symbiobacterium thermophilum]MBY6277331.1 hypothetical protein [Symbiobacterium thermophilum]
MLVLVLVVLAAGIWATKGADMPTATDGVQLQAEAEPEPAVGQAAEGAADGAAQAGGDRLAEVDEEQAAEAGGEQVADAAADQAAEADAADAAAAGPDAGVGPGPDAGVGPGPAPKPGSAGEPVYAPATSRSAIDRSAGAAETMRVTVYYVDFDAHMEALQPVQILVPFSVTPIKVSVEQLLRPPEELGLFSEFPPGTTARGFNLVDGVAVVDLSATVEGVRGETAVNAVVATLVYTLTEIPGVEAVQLWADGKPAVLDGFTWSSPLTRADVAAWQAFRVEPVIEYSGG